MGNSTEKGDAVQQSGVFVHVFGRTDVGMVRDHNEDNFLIADLSTRNRSIQPEVQKHQIGAHGTVFAVCDGMGGAAAGEVASQIAVDTIYEMLQAEPKAVNDPELAGRLDQAICEAGKRIHGEAKRDSSQRGMGTTSTVAVLQGPRLIYGQVGDSRAHIIRNGKLVQTTKDQSLVQQLIDANQLTEEEAKNFDRSNIILQALGTANEVHVDITSTVLCKGDILVMCSDGLSGMVEPEEIRDVIVSMENPIRACQQLTQMACDNGGDDNITVIVAVFDGPALQPPSSEVMYEKFEKVIPASVATAPSESTGEPQAQADYNEEDDELVEIPKKKSPLVFVIAALFIFAIAGVLFAAFSSKKDKASDKEKTSVTESETKLSDDPNDELQKDESGDGEQEDESQDESTATAENTDDSSESDEQEVASSTEDSGSQQDEQKVEEEKPVEKDRSTEVADSSTTNETQGKWSRVKEKRKRVNTVKKKAKPVKKAKPRIQDIEDNPY